MRWLAALVLAAAPAHADEAAILGAEAVPDGQGWRISVTLRHADTGWDDYADGWRVETPDGTVLGTRTLLHPHVEEQPFTRALGGVRVPHGADRVLIRARTNTGGWGESTHALTLK